jgi:hypothetical protein
LDDSTRRDIPVWLDVDAGTGDGWASQGASRLARALAFWNRLPLPVRFIRAASPRTADVRVHVIESFPAERRLVADEYRAGLTTLTFDKEGGITAARVFIARATPYGVRYSVADQEATLLHEVGHVLGLPHLGSPFALMSSRPRVSSITAADVQFARSVYRGGGCPRPHLAAGRP